MRIPAYSHFGSTMLVLVSALAMGCGHTGSAQPSSPALAVDAIEVCRATLAAGGDEASVLAACPAHFGHLACRQGWSGALSDDARTQAMTACQQTYCPVWIRPRPHLCGLDAKALTPAGRHEIWREFHRQLLETAVAPELAAELATAFADALLTPPAAPAAKVDSGP